MRFKIDWASLIVGRKLTVLAVVVFEGNFQVQAPHGAYIGRGDVCLLYTSDAADE